MSKTSAFSVQPSALSSRGYALGAGTVELCDGEIEINGMKLRPDKSKAYVEGHLSHAFPVITAYGKGLHAGTVANSWQSMLHQGFNYQHLMAIYGNEKAPIREDRILGSIVGVEFDKAPAGGWKLRDTMKKPPGMRIVASLNKNAKGADRILGQHQSGRKPFTFSMEVEFHWEDSGFAILPEVEDGPASSSDYRDIYTARQGLALSKNDIYTGPFPEQTPGDFGELGFAYCSVKEAPVELLKCYDEEKDRLTKPYQGRRVAALMGGLNGHVHYAGAALVHYGAEPTAGIDRMLASDEEKQAMADALEQLRAEVKRFSQSV